MFFVDPDRIVLPTSVTGSRRHLNSLSLDALTAVAELGEPTLFITATCNAKWREILERLPEHQTAFDRPDITVPVFREKLRLLLQNLKSGCYTEGFLKNGKYANKSPKNCTLYVMHVIEYQNRGLPHAHIVCKLKNAPEKVFKTDSPEIVIEKEKKQIKYIDGYTEIIGNDVIEHIPIITAYRPGFVEKEVLSPEEEGNNILNELVGENMLHKCVVSKINGCKQNAYVNCKNKYDTNKESEATVFGELGYPVYKRCTDKDLKVVPHNRSMLLDWRGHINCEYATSVKSCLYLYSYLFKGIKKKSIVAKKVVKNPNETIDEHEIYLNGRFLCAMDAMTRALGYPNYPKQEPSTVTIAVKLKKQMEYYEYNNKVTDMLIYMRTRDKKKLELLTFKDMFQTYFYDFKKPTTSKNLIEDEDYFIVKMKYKTVYVKKYVRNTNHIVRLQKVYPDVGELYYLRVILKNRAINKGSWEDVYSYPPYGSIDPPTFKYKSLQAAACAANYLNEEFHNEALEAMQEAVTSKTLTPACLRNLFGMFTVQGFVTIQILHDQDCLAALLEDYTNRGNKFSKAYRLFLLYIRELLRRDKKELSDFGLQYEIGANKVIRLKDVTEIDKYNTNFVPAEQLNLFYNLKNNCPLNERQKKIFNLAVTKINKKRTRGNYL